MAAEWLDLGEGNYAVLSGSNIGFIVQGDSALMIDTGLDKDGPRKALRALEAIEARLAAVVITHGHADHFGGAGWLSRRSAIPVYAPPLEAVFVAHPFLEPLFLYGGAAPIAELRGKFTLAEQETPIAGTLLPGVQTISGIEVDIVPLPGHAPEQVGIARGQTLYCGDALFPEETLQRHPILFCADLDAWLETLAQLPELPYHHIVPGHGPLVADIASLAGANANRLQEIRAVAYEALITPQEPAGILRAVAAHYGVTFAAPHFYLLALTTIHAALTSLQQAGEARVFVENNQLLWQRA